MASNAKFAMKKLMSAYSVAHISKKILLCVFTQVTGNISMISMCSKVVCKGAGFATMV
jgi:hypothetical protein